MFYFTGDLIAVLKNKLETLTSNKDDIEFIISNIHPSEADPYFWYTPHDLDKSLEERNPKLKDLFHEASNQVEIIWERTTKEDEDSYIFIAKTLNG